MSAYVVHVHDHIPGARYIGRAVGRHRLPESPFANPYRIGEADTPDRAAAIAAYRDHLFGSPHLLRRLPELRDQPLACWCRHVDEDPAPDTACHGDILVALLDFYSDEELLALTFGHLRDGVAR